MKLRRIASSNLLIVGVILAAMNGVTNASAKTPAEPIYTTENLNIMVTAAEPTFTIKLKSNPTTGYSWFLRGYDKNLVVPKAHHIQKNAQGLVGAPQFELWTFSIKPAGFIVPHQTTLRFVYTRPWQGGESEAPVIYKVTTR